LGLMGGWWGVAAVGLVAAFLLREFSKFLRGEVSLTARQKVVRVLGALLLLSIALMTVYSPLALRRTPGGSILAQDARDLGYWGICLALSVLLILMAVMDAGEISRQFVNSRKELRRGTLTRDDVDRILRADAKDHPDTVGRGPNP
jgi:hypothetical protein